MTTELQAFTALPFNMRVVNNLGEIQQWKIKVEDKRAVEKAKQFLADLRREEPNLNWKLETRGTVAYWHEFKE